MNAVVLVLAISSLLLLACDHTKDFEFVNATDVRIHVFTSANASEGSAFSLEPGATGGLVTAEKVWRGRVVARDDDGSVVFDQEITWEELEKSGRVIITRTSE
jgi:hypothetical protein